MFIKKKKIEKREKNNLEKKSKNCPKCFIEISRNFSMKKNKKKNIVFFLINNSINIKINFFEKIEENFEIVNQGEINFIINCLNCDEKIGFHNFNLNQNFLLRYLD